MSITQKRFSIGLRITTVLLIVLSFTIIHPSHTVQAYSNIYVSTRGVNNSGCGSMAAPCRTIQYAVEKAVSGDYILVAGGTYTYNSAEDKCDFLVTRAVVCFVNKDLNILGGFDSNNWSGPDPQRNLTIIDGARTYRGVAVVAYNSTSNLSMDGFTIQNGLAQGAQSSDTFKNAAYGGGMWASNGSVKLRNVVFKNNRALGANLSIPSGGAGGGGGLAVAATVAGSSTLENVTFDGNEASGGSGAARGGVGYGGGLFVYKSTLTGTALTFTNNTARGGSSSGSGSDGGLCADGLGGAGGFGEGSNIALNNITATGNQALGGNAGSSGSAGGSFGGALYSENGSFSLTVAKIKGNQAVGGVARIGGASMGGGIMTNSSATTINRAWVIANKAKSGGSSASYQAGTVGGGGGNFTHWGTSGVYNTSITNSVFADNTVEYGTPGSIVGGGGGGASFQGVQATVTHTTFAQNILGSGLVVGQAVAVLGNGDGTSAVLGNLTMRFSIISDHRGSTNSSALTVLKNNAASLSYVLFANNTRDTNLDSRPMVPGSITLTKPIYSTSVGYVSAGSPNYDYHLNVNSSAVDQAIGSSTSVDIDNMTRPKGKAPDVGAAEKGPILNYKNFFPKVKK